VTAPVLLTGDNQRAAALLASEVGIQDARAGLLPQHRVGAVRELENAGRKVLDVGDAVNDAPALGRRTHRCRHGAGGLRPRTGART
jgi:P-type E1-E2 ATPase